MVLRRLFSSFADGWPGAGLLCLRLVAGVVLIARGLTILGTGPPLEAAVPEIVAMVGGILLIAGLWTPIAGSGVAVLELWNIVTGRGDPWMNVLLGTLGVALALLGPGAWSVDARLFGWKRMDIRIPKNSKD